MEQQYTDMVIGSSYIKNEKDKLDWLELQHMENDEDLEQW